MCFSKAGGTFIVVSRTSQKTYKFFDWSVSEQKVFIIKISHNYLHNYLAKYAEFRSVLFSSSIV